MSPTTSVVVLPEVDEAAEPEVSKDTDDSEAMSLEEAIRRRHARLRRRSYARGRKEPTATGESTSLTLDLEPEEAPAARRRRGTSGARRRARSVGLVTAFEDLRPSRG